MITNRFSATYMYPGSVIVSYGVGFEDLQRVWQHSQSTLWGLSSDQLLWPGLLQA